MEYIYDLFLSYYSTVKQQQLVDKRGLSDPLKGIISFKSYLQLHYGVFVSIACAKTQFLKVMLLRSSLAFEKHHNSPMDVDIIALSIASQSRSLATASCFWSVISKLCFTNTVKTVAWVTVA